MHPAFISWAHRALNHGGHGHPHFGHHERGHHEHGHHERGHHEHGHHEHGEHEHRHHGHEGDDGGSGRGFGGHGRGRGGPGGPGFPGGPGGPGFPGGPGGPGGRFGGAGPDDGGGFGVRRPLRFLAHKLELSESQVGELARILDALKTERAQAEVDNRRTVTAFADAIEAGAFGEERCREGGDLRVKSAERLRDAVMAALTRIHALLEEEQRKRLSYLIRTGVVSL